MLEVELLVVRWNEGGVMKVLVVMVMMEL